MADIVSSSWHENTMNISEMSYDEYCILAFGKDVDELREETKPLKERKNRKIIMEQYIPKDALVAEIEKLISNGKLKCQQSQENNDQVSYVAWSEHIATCGKILSLINSLEVKEVDLEKELREFLIQYYNYDYPKQYQEGTGSNAMPHIVETAKYFFNLGLKAQKNNIRHSMNETPNYPCDILFVTNVDNMFLYRYMENGRPVDNETPYFHNILNGKCWYYCNDIVNK